MAAKGQATSLTHSLQVRPFVTDPPTEIVTLDDYFRRHRLYRLDPDLQALGAAAPLIALTDDHDYGALL